MVKIIIVDDHRLFRVTMRIALSDCYGLSVVGDADSGEALFALLNKVSCDIIMLDIAMPGMNGVEVTSLLRKLYPDIKILIVSYENDIEIVKSLVELGINGFISKQAGDVDEIVHAVMSIMDGYEYFVEDIATIIYQIYVSKNCGATVSHEFTEREKAIIELCSNGLLAKEIANKLNISVSTVQNHKYNIFRKLNINNTVEMVQYALKNKIIRL
ncbi:MAG: response regulator transcription factor [Bacteroidetes bacterium]|nr:response regulator transcription factor [Bacteroidota bacterium]MCL1968887.1 response regulator transcription factor [Bacteroidota bacterium]MCL1969002.1 response regulator transcription factor [Bacteroidota bacterium]